MRFAAWLDVSLERRLTVQLDGKVDHIAAFHEAEGRCVGPATGNVDADGRTSPDYLVGIYRKTRALAYAQSFVRETLTQQRERLFLVLAAVLASEAKSLRTEHGVLCACE